MVLSVPLALAGVAAAHGRGALLVHPPDNPFLAEAARPRVVPPRFASWPPPGLRGEREEVSRGE